MQNSIIQPSTRDKFEDMVDLSEISVATVSADPHTPLTRGNFSSPVHLGQSCSNNNIEFYTNLRRNDAGTVLKYLYDNNYLLLFVKVNVLYNESAPHPIALKLTGAGESFPVQGVIVESTGTSGDVSRRLILNQGFPEIPVEFTDAIFSKSNLSK